MKNITKFCLPVLGPRPWLNKTSQSKKRRPLFSKNVLKVVPIHVYKFSFLIPRVHTEFLVIIFDCAKNRSSTLVWEIRGDCCLKSLREKQIILCSQHLPEKNFSLIASRKEKNTRNTVKITFSCGNYNIFTFLSCCLPETRTKDQIRGPRIDHRKRSPFCEFQAKYLCLELETSGFSRQENFFVYIICLVTHSFIRIHFKTLRF